MTTYADVALAAGVPVTTAWRRLHAHPNVTHVFREGGPGGSISDVSAPGGMDQLVAIARSRPPTYKERVACRTCGRGLPAWVLGWPTWLNSRGNGYVPPS